MDKSSEDRAIQYEIAEYTRKQAIHLEGIHGELMAQTKRQGEWLQTLDDNISILRHAVIASSETLGGLHHALVHREGISGKLEALIHQMRKLNGEK